MEFGYGSFGTFVLYMLYMSTTIWIFTLIIYVLIIGIRSIWKKCLFLRQELSFQIVSFFLASFLMCSLFMFTNAIPTDSIFAGLALGIALSLSDILFIGRILAAILYRSKKLKIISGFLSSIGYVGIILLLWFYFIDGYNMNIDVIIPSERFPTNLTHDLSLNGNYSYSFLTYGSGSDHRLDYGKNASIITPTIALSSLIKLSSFNTNAFHYNASALPLNGRMWYPRNNTGPYPVVLMVHEIISRPNRVKKETEYRILFEDYRSILNYLPYTNYISTFQDSNEIIIADFENYYYNRWRNCQEYIRFFYKLQ